MKKLLLAATFVATSLSSFAQTQIPNGDFETWATFSGCSNYDSLGNFITGEEKFSLITTCNSTQSIIKSTDKYNGDYALKMLPITFETPVGTESISNHVTLGTDLSNTDLGVPFTGRPTKLTGYYKFQRNGLDQLDIIVAAEPANLVDEDDLVFFGEFTTSTTVTDYTKFEIDLDYDFPSSTESPVKLYLSVTMGDNDSKADQNSYVVIDNLVFEYTTTATTSATTTSPVNVYITQKDINFSSEVSEVAIYNLVGSPELNQTTSTKAVNAANLKSGLYVVTYKYNDNFYSKKVVVE